MKVKKTNGDSINDMIYEGKFLYHNIDRNRALWHNEGEHDIAHEHSFGYYLFTTIHEVL